MEFRKLSVSIVAAGLLFVGSNAQAALTLTGWDCSNTSMVGYDACAGSFDGNNKGAPSVVADVAAEILADFGFAVGSSYEISGGGSDSGILNFGPITGVFAIALKAGDAFSLYKFDGGVSGISSINYDTLGVGFYDKKGGLHFGQDLSHADIYLPVPEPETYAMLLAGLGLLGFSLRNKKA